MVKSSLTIRQLNGKLVLRFILPMLIHHMNAVVMRTVTEFCGFIPKGQAIEELSGRQLVQINWYLNSRPLKCLNWRTPIEIFLLNLRH